jgi:hypothetical protein
MSAVAFPVAARPATARRHALKRIGTVVLGAILFGCLAGAAAAGGEAIAAVGLVALLLPVVVWMRPQLGPTMMLTTGLLIEQFKLGLTNGSVAVNVPITNSIPVFTGLGPVHLEPADLLPVMIFAIYMIRSSDAGIRWWPRSQLSLAIAAIIGAVLYGEVIGVMHHGTIRESLFECRPFIYLACAYLLTAVMIRTRSALQAMLWAIIIAEPIKSLQGIYVWMETSSWNPKPQNVLGHEEAVFFSIYFFVVAALWIFGVRGRMRTIGTRLIPLVFFADLVNDRRTAWLILPAGLFVLALVGYRSLPEKRTLLLRVIVGGVVFSGLYLGAYWNHTGGTLGKPADAVRSEFGAPNARDALSDEYRIDEDANLKFNIKVNGLLGAGFGKQIDYALPMPGLVTAGDSGIMYVPHNSVLYILMRLGVVGGVAFWGMLGAAIIAGCRLARCPDRLLAATGAVVAAAVVGYALEGGTDMGFTFPRIAIVIGCLMGLVEAARHIHASQDHASQHPDAASARPRGDVVVRPAALEELAGARR